MVENVIQEMILQQEETVSRGLGRASRGLSGRWRSKIQVGLAELLLNTDSKNMHTRTDMAI